LCIYIYIYLHMLMFFVIFFLPLPLIFNYFGEEYLIFVPLMDCILK